MSLLIVLHRKLQKIVDVFGVRRLAGTVFRKLLNRRYGADRLMRATQNDRTWLLIPEVALRGAWAEFETVLWLREVVKPGMTVFDIGANVGQMTLEIATLVGPAGKVIAIEPGPGNVEVLRRHIAGNGFQDRVTIIDAACSMVSGEEVEFRIYGETETEVGSGHQITSLRDSGHSLPSRTIAVKTVTIDEVCREQGLSPQVIKIDVEGSEWLVLQGAAEVLKQHAPRVLVGFHPFAFDDPAATAGDILELMSSLNYTMDEQSSPADWQLQEYAFSPAISSL
jgi:FkbM family methyltransferase